MHFHLGLGLHNAVQSGHYTMMIPATNPRLIRSIDEYKWTTAEQTAMRTGEDTIADEGHGYVWVACFKGGRTVRVTIKLD